MGEPLCIERSRLLDAYFKATAELLRMNRAFSNAVLTPGGSERLGPVWGQREAARRLCGDLRRQVYEHVESHGCGSFRTSAAGQGAGGSGSKTPGAEFT